MLLGRSKRSTPPLSREFQNWFWNQWVLWYRALGFLCWGSWPWITNHSGQSLLPWRPHWFYAVTIAKDDFFAWAYTDLEMTCCVSVFQAEQIGRSGVDSDEDTSQSALGRGSNVSTKPEGASCQPGGLFTHFTGPSRKWDCRLVKLFGFCTFSPEAWRCVWLLVYLPMLQLEAVWCFSSYFSVLSTWSGGSLVRLTEFMPSRISSIYSGAADGFGTTWPSFLS